MSGRRLAVLYLGGSVYRNDTLEFIAHEEGRIRKTDTLVYDYMLKDHLGNVRMVLTTEKQTNMYPSATMEVQDSTIQQSFYASLPQTRTTVLPSGYPASTPAGNAAVAKVGASSGTNKIGPSITLKVMAGDKFNVSVNSWWKSTNTPTTPVNPLTDLVALLNSSVGAITSTHSGIKSTDLQTSNVFTPSATNFLNSQSYTSSKPKAYLNWVLFDEQFNFVANSSGFEQVAGSDAYTLHTRSNMPVTKSGYLYIYVSNVTDNIDVFFDNLAVTHIRGALLEETHYYPFGLTMSGISSKSFGNLENKMQKFNGAELNNDFDLNQYEFFYRNYNPQIGRWNGLDSKPTESISLYAAFGNNPIKNVDFLGDTTIYYSFGTDRVLRQINNEGAVQHIQVNESLFSAFDLIINAVGVDLTEQGNANSYVNGLNGALDQLEANNGDMLERGGYGRDIITRATGELSLSFEGEANATNTRQADGTLFVRRHFDNGTATNIQEYTAVGGPWGNGAPENGAYTANNLRRRTEGGFVRDGVGFTMDLNPNFETGRSLLRIHPDGNQPGTQGCVGLPVNSTQLTNFRNTMRNYLQTHPNINVNININGNPNNNGRGARPAGGNRE